MKPCPVSWTVLVTRFPMSLLSHGLTRLLAKLKAASPMVAPKSPGLGIKGLGVVGVVGHRVPTMLGTPLGS